MIELAELEGTDPVDGDAVGEALSDPVFDELFDFLVAGEAGRSADRAASMRPQEGRRDGRRWRAPVTGVAAAVVILGVLAGAGVIGGGRGLSGPFTTTWTPAKRFVHGSSRGGATRQGTWRLVDASLTGTWQQNLYGPPPGRFSCSPDGTCYVLAGRYPSAMAGAPLLSETLYVSADEGATWFALPVPSGVVPTTPLECSGARWCATGATYDGQAVLAVTRDGGHTFTIDPLPSAVGTLHALSCPSTGVCLGLVSAAGSTTEPADATFLVTDDGGTTFHDQPIARGDSMFDLACTSSTRCTVVGATDASANDILPAGVSAMTDDQGRTWRTGFFPAGFGISAFSASLTCADAQHCSVSGSIPVPNENPPQCASQANTLEPVSGALPKMSPQVASISKVEAKLAATAAAQEYAQTHSFTCTNAPFTPVGDIASSTNGGLSWTPELLPADVPRPLLDGLSCPTAAECWAAGTEAVPQRVGAATNASSPVLIGTTDGGSTWSKVVFSVPSTAPDATSQSYLSMGSVTCPTASACLASGGAAQGSRYAPVYSLVVPGS
jgi:hypothetical protein